MAFTVPDLSKFMIHLDEEGVAYGGFNAKDRKPTTRPDGVNQIYFQDPDGYWIEVNNDRF
jgi:lactoylglutathione lyase